MRSRRAREFVVASGLPGSGKSTLARQLAPALNLPLIDKDVILERLFESRGVGDAEWRRGLSRESDSLLQAEATAPDGAVLVSFWRLPGMPGDSNRLLLELPARRKALCAPHAASGHLDSAASYADVLARIRSWASTRGRHSGEPQFESVVGKIRVALRRPRREVLRLRRRPSSGPCPSPAPSPQRCRSCSDPAS
jgi:hypothetical protein